jgi:hypothetical protein
MSGYVDHAWRHLPKDQGGTDPIDFPTSPGGGGGTTNEVYEANISILRIVSATFPSGQDIADAAFFYPSLAIFPRYLQAATPQWVSGTWSGLITDYTDIAGFTHMKFYGYKGSAQYIGTGSTVTSDIWGYPYQDCGHGTIAKDNIDGNPLQAKCHFLLIPDYGSSGDGQMYAINPTTGTLLTEANLSSDFGVTMDDSGTWLITVNWAFAIV